MAQSQAQEVANAVSAITPTDNTSLYFMIVLVLALAAVVIVFLLVFKPLILKKFGGIEDQQPPTAVGRVVQDIERFIHNMDSIRAALTELERNHKDLQKAQERAERDLEASRIDATQMREEMRQTREEMREGFARIHDRIDKIKDGR